MTVQRWDFLHRDHPWPGVVSAVGYRNQMPGHPMHYGLPSPYLTVIFSLDDGVEAANSREALPSASPTPIIAAGLHPRGSFVLQRGGQTGVQLAVHPLAARALLGLPAAELSISDYDGREALGRRAATMQARLTEATDWTRAFALIGSQLARSIDARPSEVRSEVRHAWHLLARSGGRMPINEVANAVGVSSRHLGTLFVREVGCPPKTVAQLFRFQRAAGGIRAAVAAQRQVDLATVAACAGYADQSHLTRDFVDRLGVPPRRWIVDEFRNLQAHPLTMAPESST